MNLILIHGPTSLSWGDIRLLWWLVWES